MATQSTSPSPPGFDPDSLASRSRPVSFQLGTGADLYANALIPAILSARHEVILVTCFWAPSKTTTALRTCLQDLAARRRDLISQGHLLPPLKISICLSSRSLFQKLFHTSSPDGYTYPPSSWPTQLGLPAEADLESGGISLTAKSLFFLPFSVLHPKYLIVDRQRALIPSCNVSWEAWLEGCIEIAGPAVGDLLRFYSSTWDKDLDIQSPFPPFPEDDSPLGSETEPGLALSLVRRVHTFPPADENVRTSILPSPHCRNPCFRPFPWQEAPLAPPTPLNAALLRLFDEARRHIYVQTPNVTSPPVIDSLIEALRRGVDVAIVTSRNMMLLEQLITAGTTTSWCLGSLVRRYKSMCSERDRRSGGPRQQQLDSHQGAAADDWTVDTEAQVPGPGKLSISYFRPQERTGISNTAGDALEEPVHSHIKLTIVDGRFTVLGSGNMDRASWYTNQELGILFDDAAFAEVVKSSVDQVLVGRLDVIF